jgi:hypothetical protein
VTFPSCTITVSWPDDTIRLASVAVRIVSGEKRCGNQVVSSAAMAGRY